MRSCSSWSNSARITRMRSRDASPGSWIIISSVASVLPSTMPASLHRRTVAASTFAPRRPLRFLGDTDGLQPFLAEFLKPDDDEFTHLVAHWLEPVVSFHLPPETA